jgi:hypothetical protein
VGHTVVAGLETIPIEVRDTDVRARFQALCASGTKLDQVRLTTSDATAASR